VRPGLGAAVRSGVVTFLALVVAFAIPLTSPSRVAAADPGASPAPVAATHQPTCAERFPADGPGGVDLQLGCVVRELIGYFGGLGPSDEPQRLTGYLLPIAAVSLGLVALLAVARSLHRRASRRIAPATPVAWWSCPACRSLNAAGRASCYRCGRPFEERAIEMRTDAEPPAPQSFGRRTDRP
jgi:hypothetical protein